jgi:prevent-host-death family protein
MWISITEARKRLYELLRRAEAGETVVITRRGKPVVNLVPHREKRSIALPALAVENP